MWREIKRRPTGEHNFFTVSAVIARDPIEIFITFLFGLFYILIVMILEGGLLSKELILKLISKASNILDFIVDFYFDIRFCISANVSQLMEDTLLENVANCHRKYYYLEDFLRD